ncbi:alpha,alpha-trehalase TreF [Acidovorax sp. GBBC 3334]|uniref:alpha,alpha-trehalase TreF n=1 Tax=Acidovorax sp. GBBC 3334 TaxID=2940496 RepID=UPI002302A8EE|nr:alpha,alpha-trehalase TreF [Acidovorax sp. GBBC 3334]MDA8457186.1 alpha,alpha-trehalase TreF [Acidovorax sp. GBBC 3334]
MNEPLRMSAQPSPSSSPSSQPSPETRPLHLPEPPAPIEGMGPIDATPSARTAAAMRMPQPDTRSPADRYEELFVAVQRERVFGDSKTFVDCAPKATPESILAAYRAERGAEGFDLSGFVQRHFVPPAPGCDRSTAPPGLPLAAHIDALWDELARHPAHHPARGSLLELPHAYVVPGGRFVEMYYWDSYFTMLGLVHSGRPRLLHAMTDNFAYLIDTYGHVPNGTRTYYLSRSQPPVFALMAALCESCDGQGEQRYLPQMLREYAFWMDGAQGLAAGTAHRRVVALPDGSVLNRYWDDRDSPREESWREDRETAAACSRPAAEVYRDLRAAAESGWDFSSRWLDDGHGAATRTAGLASICTTRILPVDLNALLHASEAAIARLSRAAGDEAAARDFDARAARRADAMARVLWSDEAGAFLDYDWQNARPRPALTAATVVPLFTGTATPAQASALAATVRRRLLVRGGLATTETASGEQWDRPNGWAPLQWMGAEGFQRYAADDAACGELAQDIRERWLTTVGDVYAREGKLVEKYSLCERHQDTSVGGDGGEYPLQDGFGWTNGVVRGWLHDPVWQRPGAPPAPGARAGR